MDQYLDLFMNYLAVERGLARNTLDAYGRDLSRYLSWLQGTGVTEPEAITAPLILRFLAVRKEEGLAPRVITSYSIHYTKLYETLAGAERYITPALKEYEEKVLGAEERVVEIEYDLFQDVRRQVSYNFV